jgi:hypothetical protein
MPTLILSFQGLDAEEGHIEAFAGIESAAGIARSLTLVAHYAATGAVRYRFPFDDTVKLYLEATEPGSFNWKLVLAVGGPLALGLSTNAIYDLSKLVFSKAIGEEPAGLCEDVNRLNKEKSGDIDALVEAVEPALKKGHYGIGETASKIVIREETKREVIVTFDKRSKQYLLDSEKDDDSSQDVSISALNVMIGPVAPSFSTWVVPYLSKSLVTPTRRQLSCCRGRLIATLTNILRPSTSSLLPFARSMGGSSGLSCIRRRI